eukprot:30870-Pelagococcus_subviridis.AAC.7
MEEPHKKRRVSDLFDTPNPSEVMKPYCANILERYTECVMLKRSDMCPTPRAAPFRPLAARVLEP